MKKIFIANRGEMCRRIAQSAYLLGIETACLIKKNHSPSFLKDWISDFIYIEEEDASLYLNADKMIDFAKKSNCDAIHPGYGFLSENADFAKKVIENSLIWIGPKSATMDLMADKAQARAVAVEAGVPCTRGVKGLSSSKDLNLHRDKIEKLSFPLLVKAAKGGGGKGMRLVQSLEELAEGFERASSEALNSFGDASVIIEEFIENARHVEVQIIADKKGHVKVIGDRDCSLQRRHQKIIEEAPAPGINHKTRKALHRSAQQLAEKVHYESAGTVEFLLDTRPVSQDEIQGFYFLEMNTRLQVEHPVSEEVFSLDLVELQIRVARGESLAELNPICRGHALEARIYAEDPESNFFPSPGTLQAFKPFQGRGIRWELGSDEGDEISEAFDPMIAKLICYGSDRAQALKLLSLALDKTMLSGVKNNREFLSILCRDKNFMKDPCSTKYIEQEQKNIIEKMQKEKTSFEKEAELIIDYLLEQSSLLKIEDRYLESKIESKDVSASAFSLVAKKVTEKTDKKKLNLDEKHEIFITSKNNIEEYSSLSNQRYRGEGCAALNGRQRELFSYVAKISEEQKSFWVLWKGKSFQKTVQNRKKYSENQNKVQSNGIEAPVPGKVISVFAKEGVEILNNAPLFILESMKMEYEVKSSQAGMIKKILVKNGEQVKAGKILAEYYDM